MDSTQKRRAETQHPLTSKSPAGRSPIGGKFIAHGLTPSTFQPMPKPRATRQKEIDPAFTERQIKSAQISGHRLHQARLSEDQKQIKRLRGLAKLEANNARLKLERPSGSVDDGTNKNCPHCNGEFPNGPVYHMHVSNCLTPQSAAKPRMCPTCGLWFPSKTAGGRHQAWCCKEGAD